MKDNKGRKKTKKERIQVLPKAKEKPQNNKTKKRKEKKVQKGKESEPDTAKESEPGE